MIRKRIFILLFVLVIFISACKLNNDQPAQFLLVNESENIIFNLFMRSAGEKEWETDWLQPDKFIYPGEEFLIENLSPGTYDFRADSLLNYWEILDQPLPAGETISWPLTDSSARIK